MVKTRTRGYGILTLALVTLLVLMFVALCLGRYQLSLQELTATLTGQATVSPVIHNIVFSLRLPRILAAVAIGAALA
ncbi:iron chelate uptake ABC transporter family permease subunit, partial [Lactiplantibacillus pentosus]